MGEKMTSNKARKTKVEITIEGKNVSGDLAPYLKSVSFNDKTSAEVDDMTITLDDKDELFCGDWMPMIGDSLEVEIKCTNWSYDTSEESLYCGCFEIDLVKESGPPNTIEIKAVSMFNSNIRRQLRSVKYQKTTFRTICKEIAQRHNLKLNFIAASIKNSSGQVVADDDDIEITAIDQTDQSDLVFLSKLAADNDYMLKLDSEILTVCSQEYLETQAAKFVISKDDIKDRQSGREGFNLYKEAKATYFDPNKKKSISATVSHKKAQYQFQNNSELAKKFNKTKQTKQSKKKAVPTTSKSYFDQANIYGGGKTLIIRQKFSNEKEAERVAKARLAQANRGEWKISGNVMGNPFLMAGIVIEITDYGQFNGFYYVEKTTHSVTKGYRTHFEAHKVFVGNKDD